MPGSPPPFAVKFRPRKPAVSETTLYQQALDLTAVVDKILQMEGVARFHLKDLLDRHTTYIALWIGRAVAERAPAERRSLYRKIRPLVAESGTILDMLGRRASIDRVCVDGARVLVTDMIGKLEHLERR